MRLLKALSVVTALIVALANGAASAQQIPNDPDPAGWLRQVYAFYQRAENSPKLQEQANFQLVEKRASKSLAALFRKEAECVKKTKEICALDWDFVIDGQDYKLTDVKVGAAVVDGDKATVSVTLKNMGTPCNNVFDFAREGGQWKVEDIVTQSGADEKVSIAKLLRDYKW